MAWSNDKKKIASFFLSTTERAVSWRHVVKQQC